MSEQPAKNTPLDGANKASNEDPVAPRQATSTATETNTLTDDSLPTKTKKAKKKKKAGKPKSRWWWRWTKRLAIAGVVARVMLWLFLEQIANFGAGFAGLDVSWRSAALSLSGLSLHIEDLVVRDANDAEAPPLLKAQEVIADLSMQQLLGGQLSVVDAGIVGARITIHKNADGTLRLPKSWLEPAAVTLPEPEEEEEVADEPLSFELPCWIASTRLHDLQFDFIDESVTPAVHHTGKLDLDVADIGFPDRNGSVMLRFHAPQLCDELFVHTQVQTQPNDADVKFQAAVRGFRPHRFGLPQEYLDMIENAHVVDVRLGGDLNAKILTSAPKHPALAGSLDFGLSLDGIERSTIGAKFGPTEVTGVGTVDVGVVTPFSLAMQTDNVVDALRLEDGRMELSGTRTAFNAVLRGEGLTLARIRPMLEASGIELPEGGLDLTASLDAELGESMSADLARIKVRSKLGQLLALDRAAIRDLRTIDDTLAIGSVELVGPKLAIQKEADGSMMLAGLRFTPPTAAPTTNATPTAEATTDEPATPPPATPQNEAIALPKIRLGSLDWSGTDLSYTDATATPAATISLRNLHVHADAIAIGEDAPPGRVTIAFSVPDVLDKFTTELSLKSTANSLRADLQSTTSGITLHGLRTWMDPLGIQSELESGEFQFAAGVSVTLPATGFEANAELANLRFHDGKQKLLSLRSVRGTGISQANLGTWAIQDPFVKVHQDAEQVLHALGLKIGGSGATATANSDPLATNTSATNTSPTKGARPTAIAAPTAKPAANAKPRPNTLEPSLHHGELTVDRTTIAWSDARFPDRTFSIGLDAKVGANQPGEKLPVEVTLRLDRAMKTCGIEALVQLHPSHDSITGKLTATGIQGSELEMLLPEGMTCTLVDGSLDASFDAGMHKTSNTAMHANLRGLKLQDRSVELAAIDEVVLDIASSSESEVHIKDAHVKGIRAIVTMTPEALHVPGFAFASASPKDAVPVPPATTPATPGDATPPAPLTLPKLRIDALALELERFELRDRRGEDVEPLTVQTGLELQKPWVGDPAADEPVPMLLQVTGNVQPLGANFTVDTRLSPFDVTPTLDVDFLLKDFDTTQLQRVMPSLAEQVRGEATALTASAKLHAFLKMKRRDASKFDFSRSLGAELTLEGFEIRDAKTEIPYASIASIDAVVRVIHPASGTTLLRSLTIDDPKLRVEKDEHGMHVAGFVIPNPPAGAPEEGAATEPTPTEQPAPTTETPADAGEFAIDRVDLLGLSVDFKDATTNPPTHLLLTDTDAQLRRFSTRAFTEARPMSFSVAVRGGPVKLEKRVLKSSPIAGFLTAGAEALVGASSDPEYEQRSMLDELSVNGQLQLFPELLGRVNVSLTELELQAFRGMAKQAAVTLTDGLYDMRVAVDLKGTDGIDIRSNHVLTHLELDEPENGPMRRYLKLPVGIQTVLFLFRNADGQQQLPISLHVPADGVSTGTILSLAFAKLSSLTLDALGSSPERLLGGATGDLIGGSSDVPDVVIEIPFTAGSPLPDANNLQPLIEAAQDDETLSIVLTHEMGAGDQPRAYKLANPDAEVVQETITRLQQKRTELERQRTPLAADIVALFAAGKTQEAWRKQEELRSTDRQLGELLAVLNEAIEQIGNPRERKALRRTRQAATALAEARLDAVTDLLAKGYPQLLETASSDSLARIERRPGRGLPIAGVDDGGRILAVLRRRTAAELPKQRVKRQPGETPSIRDPGFTSVPPVADPSNRAFNNR